MAREDGWRRWPGGADPARRRRRRGPCDDGAGCGSGREISFPSPGGRRPICRREDAGSMLRVLCEEEGGFRYDRRASRRRFREGVL